MQELIEKLVAEVGLSSEQAGKTVETVLNFVKSKLPPAFAGNIEGLLQGKGLEQKEEGFMDKAEDMAEAAKDKLEDLAEQAKDKLGDAADKAEDLAKDAFDKIKGLFGGDKK
jgi:polyhydroxyalkanoate synthesis regulator phasin